MFELVSSQSRQNWAGFVPPDGEVPVFDFDGVLCSPIEDDLYKLPPADDEIGLLREASRVFGLNCGSLPQQYQRHLLYQCAAFFLNLPIPDGPLLPVARKVQHRGMPWFILTARSGLYARWRLDQFLNAQGLKPTEIFGIGRVAKHLQLDLLSKEHPSKDIGFFEDSQKHIDQLKSVELPRLKLYEVARETEYVPEVELLKYARSVLEEGIRAPAQGVAAAW